MEPFETKITDDSLLLMMCESWDNRTLLNMSQAYSRVYQVCSKEINRRKSRYLEMKQIDSILNHIMNTTNSTYVKDPDTSSMTSVEIIAYRLNDIAYVNINQYISEYINSSEVQWVLPGTVYEEEAEGKIRSAIITPSDLRTLAENLYKLGYQST